MKKSIAAAMIIGITIPTAMPAVAPVDKPPELDAPEAGNADVDWALAVIVSVCPLVVVI